MQTSEALSIGYVVGSDGCSLMILSFQVRQGQDSEEPG